MTAVIEVSGLGRRYGGFTAVRDVWFGVDRGELFALLGTNGAGKTGAANRHEAARIAKSRGWLPPCRPTGATTRLPWPGEA